MSDRNWLYPFSLLAHIVAVTTGLAIGSVLFVLVNPRTADRFADADAGEMMIAFGGVVSVAMLGFAVLILPALLFLLPLTFTSAKVAWWLGLTSVWGTVLSGAIAGTATGMVALFWVARRSGEGGDGALLLVAIFAVSCSLAALAYLKVFVAAYGPIRTRRANAAATK